MKETNILFSVIILYNLTPDLTISHIKIPMEIGQYNRQALNYIIIYYNCVVCSLNYDKLEHDITGTNSYRLLKLG